MNTFETPPAAVPSASRKTIPPARNRLQSRILVWSIAPILVTLTLIRTVGLFLVAPQLHLFLLQAVGITLCFAVFSWRVRAATPAAAVCGGVLCLYLIYSTGLNATAIAHTALPSLIALFILTFLATRAGRHRKAIVRLAESRSGRTASQVIANLGFAALFAFPLGPMVCLLSWPNAYTHIASMVVAVGVLSALAEATADTVSSEIGQAFGGRPFLLTTFRRTETGVDGAISLTGTFAGILAAAVVAGTGTWSMHLRADQFWIVLTAATLGLFFDSLLGATVERRGYLGNDLVNFASTAFAAATVFPLSRIAMLFPHR